MTTACWAISKTLSCPKQNSMIYEERSPLQCLQRASFFVSLKRAVALIFPFGVPQIFIRTHAVAYQLLQFLDFRKTALPFPVEYFLLAGPDGKTAGDFAWNQQYAVELFREGAQYFLGHIGCPEHPPAFRAVFNFYGWFHQINLFSSHQSMRRSSVNSLR